MTIPDHELPGWLVVIILGLVILSILLALAFLGYLPSPLSTQLEAQARHNVKIDRTLEIVCGAHMEWVGRGALVCFDESINPRDVFVGVGGRPHNLRPPGVWSRPIGPQAP